MDNFSIGMLINYSKEYDRDVLRARGENVPDPEEQYRKLLQIKPLVEERYQSGMISKEEYDGFVQSIREYEEE